MRRVSIFARYGFWPIAGAEGPPAAPAADPATDPPTTPPADDKDKDLTDDEKALDERTRVILRANREAERKARRDAAALQKQLDEAQAKLKEVDDAKLSEQERAQKDLETARAERDRLHAENRRLLLQSTVERVAAKLGFADPEDAYAHVVLNPTRIEYGDDGAPTNVESVLKALLEAKPHLKAGTGAAGGGVPATPRAHDTQSREQQIEEKRQKLAASGQYAPL
jgi:hypothetical protein